MNHRLFNNKFLSGEYEDPLQIPDAKLFTEDGWSFNIHRLVLAKVSSYFRALFYHADQNKNTILVPGVSGQILSLILSYLYGNTVQLNDENIEELLFASDYLLIDTLKRHISDYYINNISITNCFPIYMASLTINYVDLVKFSYRYIQTNFQTLIYNDRLNFEEISLQVLKNILQDNNLFVKGEDVVWLSIVKWIMVNPRCRFSQLPDLLKCLRIADIDDSLASEIIDNDIICKNPLYKEIIGNNQNRDSNPSLNILKCIIQSSSLDSDPSAYNVQNHRQSECLHFYIESTYDIAKLFVTYDENLDLWRKLGGTQSCPTFLTVIGHRVYIFDDIYNHNMMFDLYEKQWRAMPEPRIQRLMYHAVAVNKSIFIIGGVSEENDTFVTSVEFYNTELEMWFDAMPMTPISEFGAVSYENKIWVVGKVYNENNNFLVQVYDVDSNAWSLMEAPITYRFDFALEVYHGKLYIIGGSDASCLLKTVDVFDFKNESWESIPDLPYAFQQTEALVFDDQIIVFDFEEYDVWPEPSPPPVAWNEDEKLWEPWDKPLFLKPINSHLFHTIEDKDEIRALLKQIRDPSSNFEKNPF